MLKFQHPILALIFILNLFSCQSMAKLDAGSDTFLPSRVPASLCDAKDFGARGDGKTKDTMAIQAAIGKCAGQGGVVLLHDGIFLTGMIRLRTGVELRIEPSAVLKGSQDDSDYPDVAPPIRNTQLSDCKKALVYAESTQHIKITGGGTIDGSGGNPRWTGKEYTRPIAVLIAVSSDVTVQGISVKDSAMWGVVSFENDNVIIRDVNIHSLFSPNRDGIDIVDSHHVLIENCTIASGDDSICLKSGSAKGVFDITVRNSHILQTKSNALKLGTASVGFFRKILFENVKIENAQESAMAVESIDGGAINDVRFRNIDFESVGTPVFMLLGRRLLSASVGTIENVNFEHVNGTAKLNWGSVISGTRGIFSTYTIRNINFNDVHIQNLASTKAVPAEPAEYQGQYPDPYIWAELPAYGFYLRHIDGVTFTDTTVKAPAGEARARILQNDVANFVFR